MDSRSSFQNAPSPKVTPSGGAELLALPDLFLLNDKNRAFIEGRARRIKFPAGVTWPSPYPPVWTVFYFFYLGVFPVLLAQMAGLIGPIAVDVILLAECLGLIAIVGRLEHRRFVLAQHGQLLRGIAVKIEKTEKRHSVSSHGGRVQFGRYWSIKFHYRFEIPGEQTLDATKAFNTWKQPSWNTGDQGRSIAVLYLNEKLYDVL